MSQRVQISGELLEVIKSRPVSEIDGLFDALIKQKALEVTACQTTEDLWKHQASVKCFFEIKQFFLNEMRRT